MSLPASYMDDVMQELAHPSRAYVEDVECAFDRDGLAKKINCWHSAAFHQVSLHAPSIDKASLKAKPLFENEDQPAGNRAKCERGEILTNAGIS
jgi:hypothetical protein